MSPRDCGVGGDECVHTGDAHVLKHASALARTKVDGDLVEHLLVGHGWPWSATPGLEVLLVEHVSAVCVKAIRPGAPWSLKKTNTLSSEVLSSFLPLAEPVRTSMNFCGITSELL